MLYRHGDGALHEAADFSGDISFVQSALAIVRARNITAQLVMLPAIATEGAHRRALADSVREVIGGVLGYCEDQPGI